jgi:hypothetical protein
MLRLVNHFTIMFTWGVVFPPLCVLACIALCINTYHIQVGIGRRLVLAEGFARSPNAGDNMRDGDATAKPARASVGERREPPSPSTRASAAIAVKSKINRECAGLHGYVRDALLPIVALSLMLYAFIVFDTLGDVKGYDGAYWVVLVIGLEPLSAAFAFIYFLKGTVPSKPRNDSNTTDCLELPSSSAVDNPML